MNLYKVERTTSWSWDEYDAFVVACESEEIAKKYHPAEELDI